MFTYDANQRILAAWQAIDGGIRAFLMIAYVDLFPFMPASAAMGFTWGVLVARRRSGWLRRMGIACALCIFPAWLADIVETGLQAVMSLRLDDYPPNLVPIMSTAAVIKFAFFGITLLWCLVGTILLIVGKLRGNSTAR